MPVLTNQLIVQGGDRTYHVHVPANPAQTTVPAIVVFHGGGQDADDHRPSLGAGTRQSRSGQRRRLSARVSGG